MNKSERARELSASGMRVMEIARVLDVHYQQVVAALKRKGVQEAADLRPKGSFDKRTYMQDWWLENGRDLRRVKEYDLYPEEFDVLLMAQCGKCAICGELLPDPPDIDHDHTTDMVRGLLCHTCNLSLGRYEKFVHLERPLSIQDYLQ